VAVAVEDLEQEAVELVVIEHQVLDHLLYKVQQFQLLKELNILLQ
jgi:hypothetical protein